MGIRWSSSIQVALIYLAVTKYCLPDRAPIGPRVDNQTMHRTTEALKL
jgi:hypothetical protein